MTRPSSMTELEAVNVLLTTIGEQPVNTLAGNQVVDVTIAKQVLNEVTREVQSKGWHFNTEYRVRLTPNLSGEIVVPADTSRIDVADLDCTVRNGKLFNLGERTYQFSRTVEADIVFYQDFFDMPDVAKRYTTIKAARIYSDRMVNSETIHAFTAKDEQMALIDLKEFEGDVGDYNMLQSFSVGKILARGATRKVF